MNKPFVGLIILDGFGLRKEKFGNAIKNANTKNLDFYFKNYPYTTLKASGESVGLPHGQIGNSEVGHLNIGAGKVVYQSLLKINNSIQDNSFYSNTAILKAFNHSKKFNSSVHLMGLVSDGGVHSHINHLIALIKMAKMNNVKNLFIHCFTDGRDTLRDSAKTYLNKVEDEIKNTNYKIATICGRLYAMDRENKFDRIELAYDAIVNGISKNKFNNVNDCIDYNYKIGNFDEFIEPAVIEFENGNFGKIENNDSIIMFNFREDRARELTECFINKNFDKFKTKNLENLFVTTFTQYDEKFKPNAIAFDKEIINNNLSEVISKNGLKQFKITETTKFAHVTYFINGGIEKPYKNEERYLIPTINSKTFDEFPKMRACEITEKAIELIKTNNYNFMVLNYSNCDMIGHTGNMEAAIEAVNCIDEQIKYLIDSIISVGGVAIITADHGNAEEMINSKGQVLTDHTTNEVPFCVINYNKDIELRSGCALSNIAPTILEILNCEKPKEMVESIIVKA